VAKVLERKKLVMIEDSPFDTVCLGRTPREVDASDVVLPFAATREPIQQSFAAL
jgi:hypothetical protein